MKELTEQTFEELKQFDSTVPRDKNRHIVTSFKVGKEYEVRKYGTKETLKVRCTQDCPTHIKIIS
jgi:hypothetical protein